MEARFKPDDTAMPNPPGLSDYQGSPWWLQIGHGWYDLGTNTLHKVTLDDVALALSRISRFAGNVANTGIDVSYTVARHSVYVSKLLDFDRDAALYGLLHDGHECVFSDIPTPVKSFLGPKAEARIRDTQRAVDRHLFRLADLAPDMPPWIATAVKRADLAALMAEKRDLLPQCARAWDLTDNPAPAPVEFSTSWDDDYHLFASRYKELTGNDLVQH